MVKHLAIDKEACEQNRTSIFFVSFLHIGKTLPAHKTFHNDPFSFHNEIKLTNNTLSL